MKDRGNLKSFLSVEVLSQDKGYSTIRKKYYTHDLIIEERMMDYKSLQTPMIINHGLQIIEVAKQTDHVRNQRLVTYLSHTRPNIAYAIGVLIRCMHTP